MTLKALRPMPDIYGIGLTTNEVIPPEIAEGYRFEQVGRYFNYHFTAARYDWPQKPTERPAFTIDGFSPNLNKQLHVGHLRNLAIANSLSRFCKNSKFVALLGHSLGVLPESKESLQRWFDLVGYKPELYSDVEITEAAAVKGGPGEGEQVGCEVWPGPHGPVIIRRSDGRPTYAMHDLSFMKIVAPDYYLTGGEQAEHFKGLGLEKKHLAMGLVLDPVTGKKMKSREGNALSAEDALKLVLDKLDKTYEPEKLAWNVLAWNFLHCGRKSDVKFNVEEWTKPDSQGLYTTYSFARICGASIVGAMGKTWKPAAENFTEDDVKLMGFASYMDYYRERAAEMFDPAPLAFFSHELARKLSSTYHAKRISDGPPGYQYAVDRAWHALGDTMILLGMHPLTDV